MTQLEFDSTLPVAGKTSEARHASATGAIRGSQLAGTQTLAYREVLRAAGPLSDHAASRLLGVGLSTICSTRNRWIEALPGCIEPSGEYETHTFASGRSTKAVMWRWCEKREKAA